MFRLSKLFGKQPEPRPNTTMNAAAVPTRTAEELRSDPNYIRVFDKFGREMFITKEQWRTGSLPEALKSSWNKPDELYGIVAMAFNDGFFSDVVEAAAHLHRTDNIPSRGASVYGIVLMKMRRMDEAEEVFRSYLSGHGEDGVILTNLAKVYSARNETQRTEETLWHALEVDPNMENALSWHRAILRERDGEAAEIRELERIAALPGSWRSQLWLARTSLLSQDLSKALDLYRQALSHVGQPVPTDLLTQMSGDLGNHGHLSEALQLTEQHFVPKIHGLLVGNNLIKAHHDLGQIEAAAKILDQLYSLQRPDWKEQLSFWDTAIAKARIAANTTILEAPLKTTMLSIEGPVWLKPSSTANSLFTRKPKHETFICFLGGSATIPSDSDQVRLQLADHPGRLSRALPLLLAEQTHFHTRAGVQTLIPWIENDPGGFIVSGAIWPDADAANYARMAQPRSQYVVVIHLKAFAADAPEPWRVELHLVRTTDAECIGKLETSFLPANPEESLCDLARRLAAMLAELKGSVTEKPSSLYQVPDGAQFSNYLLRLEQLLTVRCAGMEGRGSTQMHGEHEMVDGILGLCLSCPTNVPVRILLAESLAAMKRSRPDVVAQFTEKVKQLQTQYPLAGPADSVVQRLIDEALQSPLQTPPSSLSPPA